MTQRQVERIIGDTVAGVAAYVRDAGERIVIEQMDFRHKEAALEGDSRK